MIQKLNITTQERRKSLNPRRLIQIEILAELPLVGCTRQHQWDLLNEIQKRIQSATDELVNSKELTLTGRP
ncbi:MAG: hypothetical protein K2Y22_04425 [Candidatus Obscuribacterales bacterium]|nr:hypothetical protein [Candidatus Obscuribacterales bacterium]